MVLNKLVANLAICKRSSYNFITMIDQTTLTYVNLGSIILSINHETIIKVCCTVKVL